jgi:hypothetical protein
MSWSAIWGRAKIATSTGDRLNIGGGQAAIAACGVLIVGWMKSLSEAGAERAIVNGAARLEQQIGAAS